MTDRTPEEVAQDLLVGFYRGLKGKALVEFQQRRKAMDSKTPRTDAFAKKKGWPQTRAFYGACDFARQLETELAAANEQRKVAKKESADSEQLRYEENRKVCEWLDRALAAEFKLEAARAEQIERILKLIGHSEETAALAQPGWETGYAAALRAMDAMIRAQMDTTQENGHG